MKRKSGFTLIELMIVVAIIAIIAAIAIPSILRSRMSANQTSAVGSLDSILKMNNIFRENDEDRNGTNDYWTEHVWGIHAVENADGEEIELIPQSLADSDYEGGDDDVSLTDGSITDMTNASTYVTAKSGYFVAMLEGLNDAGGTTQSLGGCDSNYDDGDSGGEYTNKNRFAAEAFPELYDNTGTKGYLVTQSGDTFEIDARSDVDGGSNTFNASDDTPNGTKASAHPVPCKPSESQLDNNWSLSG